MLENGKLTPEKKIKLKRVLIGVAIFMGAYLGAKNGAKAALKDLKIDLNLISDSVSVPIATIK